MRTRRRHPIPRERQQARTQLNHLFDGMDATRTERLLVDLINIYSPSYGEQEIQDFIVRYLEAHGLPVDKQPVGDRGRCNVVVQLGEGPIGLLFLGHVDTVVKWYQGDFRVRSDGACLRGLGCADMKSGCAALIEAVISLSRLPHPAGAPAIGLALVVGEEEDGDGIEALIERIEPAVAVVAEPTNLRLCHEHFGFSELLLTTHGRRAHSALPEVGHNAIEAMFTVVNGLNAALSAPDPARGRQGFVCNLRELRGGSNAFVVPDYCEAVLDVHIPPAMRVSQLNEELRTRLKALAAAEPAHRCDLRIRMAYNGYALPRGDARLRPLLAACGDIMFSPEFDSFRSHSDANCLRSVGTHPIVIGPGDLQTAHTIDERVPLKELHLATRLYAAMGARYRAERTGTHGS